MFSRKQKIERLEATVIPVVAIDKSLAEIGSDEQCHKIGQELVAKLRGVVLETLPSKEVRNPHYSGAYYAFKNEGPEVGYSWHRSNNILESSLSILSENEPPALRPEFEGKLTFRTENALDIKDFLPHFITRLLCGYDAPFALYMNPELNAEIRYQGQVALPPSGMALMAAIQAMRQKQLEKWKAPLENLELRLCRYGTNGRVFEMVLPEPVTKLNASVSC